MGCYSSEYNSQPNFYHVEHVTGCNNADMLNIIQWHSSSTENKLKLFFLYFSYPYSENDDQEYGIQILPSYHS